MCDYRRRFSPHLKGRTGVTLEERISRAERVLKVFARKGREYRNDFRQKINILINCQIDTNEQLNRTAKQLKETDEQIKKTDEQIKKTDEQIKKTDEQIEALAVSQAKTDEALRRYLNSLK
jgi:peptidoglycan hydrolase CwlO-like protein